MLRQSGNVSSQQAQLWCLLQASALTWNQEEACRKGLYFEGTTASHPGRQCQLPMREQLGLGRTSSVKPGAMQEQQTSVLSGLRAPSTVEAAAVTAT